jgi:hypothetical protein
MAAGEAKGKPAKRRWELSKRPPFGIAARRMERTQQATATSPVRARPHPVYFAGAAGWVVSVAVASTLVIRHNDLSAAGDWAVVGWGCVAALAGVVGPVVRWLRTSIELDADGARCTTGIVWRWTLDVALDEVRELSIEQSYVGRRLGYGYVRIVDGAGAEHVLPPVGNVAAWQAAITQRLRRAASRRA